MDQVGFRQIDFSSAYLVRFFRSGRLLFNHCEQELSLCHNLKFTNPVAT